jgi:hypothetical protein
LFLALLLDLGFHRFRPGPTMGEAKLGEHGTGRREAEILDQVLAQEPHRDGIDEECAAFGERSEAWIRLRLEELIVVQMFSRHIS